MSDNNVVNKAYVDAKLQGLSIKPSVRLATTEVVSLSGLASKIDNVTIIDGDRILVKKTRS